MAARGSRAARVFVLALLGIAVALVAMVVRPYAKALFMAAVLAVTCRPAYDWLLPRLRGRRTLTASVISALMVVAIVLPVSTLGVTAIRESVQILDSAHEILAQEGVEGLILRIPQAVRAPVEEFWLRLPSRERNAQFIFNLERQAAGALPPLLMTAGEVAAQTVLMVIAMFFLLLDGARLMDWLDGVLPLRRNQLHELFQEFRKVSVSVLLGSVVTAAVQAVVAFIGYLIAQVPNTVVLTLVTFCLALVPVFGAGMFSFLVAVWLYLNGHLVPAIFLAAWSVLAVGLIDNLVKPLVIRGGIAMHGAVVFFALLGGVTVFGLAGVILGPLSVALLLAILRIYKRDFATPEERTG